MADCIFCKIVKGEIPSKIVYEDKNVLAFHDVNPAADVHILVIPKKHIEDISSINKSDQNLLFEMLKVSRDLAGKFAPKKFRLVFNGGSLLEVQHLHLHLLGGNLGKNAKWD